MTELWSKYGKWIIVALMILALLIVFAVMRSCDGWRSRSAVEAQADQTTASSEAIATAAAEAVDAVVAQTVEENEIDAAVAVAMEKVDHAANSDDVRDAVLAHVCVHNPSYRNDPACAVYRAGP